MKQALQMQRIIHAALLLGPLSFLGVVAFLIPQEAARPDGGDQSFLLFGLVAGVAAGIASFVLPGFLLARLTPDGGRSDGGRSAGEFGAGSAGGSARPLSDMMGRYSVAKIVQWALVESAGLLNAVVFFMSGDPASAVTALVLLALLAFHRPTKEDFVRLTGLPEHRLHELDV